MSLAHFAECAICMDYIMEMVSVPCGMSSPRPYYLKIGAPRLSNPVGHVFCNSCLQKHIVANGKRMSCACPGCNVEFSLG